MTTLAERALILETTAQDTKLILESLDRRMSPLENRLTMMWVSMTGMWVTTILAMVAGFITIALKL